MRYFVRRLYHTRGLRSIGCRLIKSSGFPLSKGRYPKGAGLWEMSLLPFAQCIPDMEKDSSGFLILGNDPVGSFRPFSIL